MLCDLTCDDVSGLLCLMRVTEISSELVFSGSSSYRSFFFHITYNSREPVIIFPSCPAVHRALLVLGGVSPSIKSRALRVFSLHTKPRLT